MPTLDELLAEQSPESLARINQKAEALRMELTLYRLREELEISQTEMALSMGIAQPTLARMERTSNDPKLSTLKRYVTALGGELSIDVKLPNGKHIAFDL
ncbi:helix-turn-helix domain-containing protein [Phytobacter sp. V91]|uniref:helix-turn-helix domain-containing protein n=1 Tax=Phytobacter sp. V91 TaxID=3369425 RepID=UPI003F636C35